MSAACVPLNIQREMGERRRRRKTQPPTVVCKMEVQLKYITRCTHVFARLGPICTLSRCLLTKFSHRSSVRSLSRLRCWSGRRREKKTRINHLAALWQNGWKWCRMGWRGRHILPPVLLLPLPLPPPNGPLGPFFFLPLFFSTHTKRQWTWRWLLEFASYYKPCLVN